MTQEIESVRPILTVIDDEGDLILSSTGPRGKAMAQAVLALSASARKVTVISDGSMTVMKRAAGTAANGMQRIPELDAKCSTATPEQVKRHAAAAAAIAADPDIQDQFAADLAAGVIGEAAMGEQPAPTPGPSDPVKVPTSPRRKPVIFQDAAAPLAPELAEAEMARLLEEAAAAEREQVTLAEQQRFQQQQVVQAGQEPSDVPSDQAAESSPARPRRRERTLATTGRPCGRCSGAGQIVGDSGFAGACPVCHGEGTVKTWDRSLKVR